MLKCQKKWRQYICQSHFPFPPVFIFLLLFLLKPLQTTSQQIENLLRIPGSKLQNLAALIPDQSPDAGVTTYDLVLMSKHILGIAPLGSPYKMIAADANKSNSITTSDIVELRKLILGIYDTLPANTSWRFIPTLFAFQDTLAPFEDAPFPGSITGYDASGANTADFIAIKTGDVNNSVDPHMRPSARPVAPVSWPGVKTRPGQVVTVPVMYSGTDPLQAFQFGMCYDTNTLLLVGPSQGDLPGLDAGSFNVKKPGEIKMLWLPMDPENPGLHVEPGAVLFNLTFKITGATRAGILPLRFDDALLANAAWKTDDTECAVQAAPMLSRQEPATAATGMEATIRPNPASGESVLALDAPEKGKVRIGLFDAFGSRLMMRDVNVTAGKQEIPLPETASLPAGVYVWKVVGKNHRAQGQLVKL